MPVGNTISNLSRYTLRRFIRGLSISHIRSSSYDSDGKTTAIVLNQQIGSNVMVDSYSITGFRLNNGVYIVGPVAVFPRSVLSWNISNDFAISEQSLKLFMLLEPKLDILVIGYGDRFFNRSKLDIELLKLRKQHNMNIELLPTEKAIATYNFLVSESRWVAAALIPPKVVSLTDDDFGVVRKRPEKSEEQRG